MSVHKVRLSFCRINLIFRAVSNAVLCCVLFLLCSVSQLVRAEEQKDSGDANNELLEQYIQS